MDELTAGSTRHSVAARTHPLADILANLSGEYSCDGFQLNTARRNSKKINSDTDHDLG